MGESEKKVPKTLKDMSPVRLIVSSFFAIIILGPSLLYLPIASKINWMHIFRSNRYISFVSTYCF